MYGPEESLACQKTFRWMNTQNQRPTWKKLDRLTDVAQQQGLVIRVMGPIALHYYFPEYVDLYRRYGAPGRTRIY